MPQIFEFRNDSRVEYHPSYTESRLKALHTLQEMFSTLLANKTLDRSTRVYYQRELAQVQLSISQLQRSAA